MKKLLLLFSCITVHSFAEEVPAFMKDATITVKLKNGKEYTFNANKYKVVKRQSSQAVLAPAPSPTTQRNRIAAGLGGGFTGNSTTVLSDRVIIKRDFHPVFGVHYSRDINEDVFLGATAITNGTFLLNVGTGF